MKKYISLFFLLFFLSLGSYVLAGSTTLTTYYPAPTAAYNKVKLATTATSTPNSTGLSCISTNNCPNGTIYVDANGTLNVWVTPPNNLVNPPVQNTVYPQECYNAFCSYNSQTYPTVNACSINGSGCPCRPYLIGTINQPGQCKGGFLQMPVDSSSDLYDTFPTSTQTTVVSIVCCTSSFNTSGTANSSAYPPDESSTPPPTSTQ